MKLATYRAGDAVKIGVVNVVDNTIFDVAAAAPRAMGPDQTFASMLALIDGGERALDNARALVETHGNDKTLSIGLDAIELLAPLPEPRQMRDAMSFPTHILQACAHRRRAAW